MWEIHGAISVGIHFVSLLKTGNANYPDFPIKEKIPKAL